MTDSKKCTCIADPDGDGVLRIEEYSDSCPAHGMTETWRNPFLYAEDRPETASLGEPDDSEAWRAVWDLCLSLGMNPLSEKTGLDCVLRFISRHVPGASDVQP